MKILIAEDEPASQLLLRALLEKQGHEVTAASDGQEAWNLFRAERFPLVLSDWMMPRVNGIDLAKMIRALCLPDYTHIIMVTSLEGKSRYIESLDAGADDFVNKPFDPDELAARLRVAERMVKLHGHVTQLEGLLSVCAYCKRIREEGSWTSLERFVSAHAAVSFSHGICPDCKVVEMEKVRALRNP